MKTIIALLFLSGCASTVPATRSHTELTYTAPGYRDCKGYMGIDWQVEATVVDGVVAKKAVPTRCVDWTPVLNGMASDSFETRN